MGRFIQTLAQIVSLASLTAGCSDDDGPCYSSGGVTPYDVPLTSSEGGAGGAPAGGAGAAGQAELDCAQACGFYTCQVIEDSLGQTVARCYRPVERHQIPCPSSGVVEGRRPAGLVELEHPSTNAAELGTLFARMAHLEAASIHAFARLRRELHAHGASPALLALVHRAARDEVRHARQMSALARAHDASVPRVQLAPFRVRSRFEIACENEIEGCVRETYGAVVALWQAEHAATPELRALFRAIAHDEAQHAELAFRVRDWLLPQLRQHQRGRIDDARRAAMSALAEELSAEPPTAWQRVAGLPDASTARRLLVLLAPRLSVGVAA